MVGLSLLYLKELKHGVRVDATSYSHIATSYSHILALSACATSFDQVSI